MYVGVHENKMEVKFKPVGSTFLLVRGFWSSSKYASSLDVKESSEMTV